MTKLTPYIKNEDLGFVPTRLDMYRTLNPWWSRLWRTKYDTHLLVMSKDAIYDICPDTKRSCTSLFGANSRERMK